jgi:sec-independent protein translocase protein TatB
MFEVGFTEIVLIFGIALLVLGPKKLPKLAADVGRWAGRARAMARQLRTQLEQEVQYDPLQDHARAQPAAPVTPTIHAPPAPTPPAEPGPAAIPTPIEPHAAPAEPVTAAHPTPIEPHATPAAMTSNEPKPE